MMEISIECKWEIFYTKLTAMLFKNVEKMENLVKCSLVVIRNSLS